jgi:hypothetical protein
MESPEYAFFQPCCTKVVTRFLGAAAVDPDAISDTVALLSRHLLWAWWKKVAVVSEITRDVYGHDCELRSLCFLAQYGFPSRRPAPAVASAFPAGVDPESTPASLAAALRVTTAALGRVVILPEEMQRRMAWALAEACHEYMQVESFRYRAYAGSMDSQALKQRVGVAV